MKKFFWAEFPWHVELLPAALWAQRCVTYVLMILYLGLTTVWMTVVSFHRCPTSCSLLTQQAQKHPKETVEAFVFVFVCLFVVCLFVLRPW